ncbi:peptidase E [Mesobacillus harenae]|uniref:Type 1 glutamine amidotransferase-like domain-containing protein n=1 Tax=Mesobacillus harenae TaxID=2213203 RepID=UPI001580ABCF|nr:peptidase E [Mesobacillus harenae]
MKQIIALGGGGFSMEPENLLLDLYILEQSGKSVPNICFVPTASGDSENYIAKFYKAFEKLKCTPSHLSLFRPPTRDLESFILEKDIIYVGGGSTKNLMALWKEWNVDKYMKKAWNKGIMLAGVSAGSLCWFEDGVTDSYGKDMDPINGLGLLRGSNCPHYDGEVNRRPAYQKFVASKLIQGGIAADDGVGLHFVDDSLKNVVSSRPNAKAYKVMPTEDFFYEEEMVTKYLG